MDNKERCPKLLDDFTDEQLAGEDDAFCMRLYADYQNKADKDDGIPIEDFAKELGIAL